MLSMSNAEMLILEHEVLQNVLVNECSDIGFQKNTMDQHQQMTWKWVFWDADNQPVC